MSEGIDRWALIAADADLGIEDIVALQPLFARLADATTELPAPSPRVANRVWFEAHEPAAGTMARRWTDFTNVGRAQVSLFGLPFWFVSIAVMLAGAGAEAAGLDPSRRVAFYLAAPLLAYIATATAFRGQGVGPQELERATPVSPRELLLVRLFLVLLYDAVICLGASLPLAAGGVATLSSITFSWLSPLILLTGVTLILTSWLRAERAGALAYGAWVVVVLGSVKLALAPSALLPALDVLMLALGCALISAVVVALPGRFTMDTSHQRA